MIVEGDGVTYATIDLGRRGLRPLLCRLRQFLAVAAAAFPPRPDALPREDFDGYLAVNDAFAAALLPLLQPDDTVWVHDYHLIPLGGRTARRGFKGRIGFFLHIPFVPPSVLEALPPARESAARDVCAYDVVGFQTRTHLADFLDCARRFSGFAVDGEGVVDPGRPPRARHRRPDRHRRAGFAHIASARPAPPISSACARAWSAARWPSAPNAWTIPRACPTASRASPGCSRAFPQHQRRVSMLQIAARSREDVAEYQALRRELDRLAGDINGRFSGFDWVPLRYMTQTVARTKLAGLFRIARIGLVTPLRDGMNLVAKEFVAAQDPADPGVLILSRFAGAANDSTTL